MHSSTYTIMLINHEAGAQQAQYILDPDIFTHLWFISHISLAHRQACAHQFVNVSS